MMNLYLTIYLCMIPIIVAVSAIVAGYQKAAGKIIQAREIVGPTMILSALWPGLLLISCILAPFVALYQVGQFLAAKE